MQAIDLFKELLLTKTLNEIAELLNLHIGTLRRWKENDSVPKNYFNDLNSLLEYKYENKEEFRDKDQFYTTKKTAEYCYKKTLEIKKNNVQNLVNKNLKNTVIVKDTLGMENPFHYRNKAQYPVGIDNNKKPIVGVFANRTHDVIQIDKCLIQNEQSEQIAKFICEFANENNFYESLPAENFSIA